jgi:ribosomal protein S18 acetylase RimI-like enzyme
MIIRLAREADAPAMAGVMVDTFLAAHHGQMPEAAWIKRKEEWTYAVSEESWAGTLRELDEDENAGMCIYVAEDEGGDLVGLAMGCPAESAEKTGAVTALYVRESHQGRGIGRRLVQAVAAHLAQRGMPALEIGALAANAPARRFYEALGGRVVGERMFDEEGYLLPEVVYGWADTRRLIEG